MPLPERWMRGLDATARAGLARAEAHVAAREAAGANVYPPAELRYRALEFVAPDKVKVVILGQDPYHGAGQAMGLAFSVPRGIRVPASLVKVYEEIERDLEFISPNHGDLTPWVQQGVLLLNTSFTVEGGLPTSHSKIGWNQVTDSLIKYASAEANTAVFMFWGNHARAKAPLVDRTRHLVLESAHPSPLAGGKFAGCKHFSQANTFLAANGLEPVRWNL